MKWLYKNVVALPSAANSFRVCVCVCERERIIFLEESTGIFLLNPDPLSTRVITRPLVLWSYLIPTALQPISQECGAVPD